MTTYVVYDYIGDRVIADDMSLVGAADVALRTDLRDYEIRRDERHSMWWLWIKNRYGWFSTMIASIEDDKDAATTDIFKQFIKKSWGEYPEVHETEDFNQMYME